MKAKAKMPLRVEMFWVRSVIEITSLPWAESALVERVQTTLMQEEGGNQ